MLGIGLGLFIDDILRGGGEAVLPFDNTGVVAYWNFYDSDNYEVDSTGGVNSVYYAADLSGNGHHLYQRNKNLQPGYGADGIEFLDGHYLEVENKTNFLQNVSGGFTFSALVNSNDNNADQIILFVAESAGITAPRAMFYHSNNNPPRSKFRGSVSDLSQVSSIANAAGFTQGNWVINQIEVNLSGNTVSFWDDNTSRGVNSSVFSESPRVLPDSEPLAVIVGNAAQGFLNTLKGKILAITVTSNLFATGQRSDIYDHFDDIRTYAGG